MAPDDDQTLRRRIDPEQLERETEVSYFRSPGPGGQKKNKTETAVRLKHIPSGITTVSTRHRSRLRNREAAFERLAARIEERNRPVKPRIPTRKSRGAVESVLEQKRRRSRIKRLRGPVRTDRED